MKTNQDINSRLFYTLFNIAKTCGLYDIHPDIKLKFFDENLNSNKYSIQGIEIQVRAYYTPIENSIFLGFPLFYKNSIITMCHELVHAEQFYKNKLTIQTDQNNRKWFAWRGHKKIRIIDVYNLQLDEYRELPWEKEAYERERPLAEKLLEKYNEKGSTRYAPVF